MKFPVESLLASKKTGKTYRVLGAGIYEPTVENCYLYAKFGSDGPIWVMPQDKMEDGRFSLVAYQDKSSEP